MRLRRLLGSGRPSEEHFREMEAELAVISSSGGRDVVGWLCPLLRDDDVDYLHLYWSMVHVMEELEMDPYAVELLHCLPALRDTAPEWASILVVRVMNAPLGALAFMKALPGCEVAELDALRAVLVAWSDGDPAMAKEFAGMVEMIDYVKGRRFGV